MAAFLFTRGCRAVNLLLGRYLQGLLSVSGMEVRRRQHSYALALAMTLGLTIFGIVPFGLPLQV